MRVSGECCTSTRNFIPRECRPSTSSMERTERMDMQKVWVVSELYYPEDTSTGFFLTEIAEELAAIIASPSQSSVDSPVIHFAVLAHLGKKSGTA